MFTGNVRLRGGVLEQVVEHDLRVGVGAQLDHEAGLALPRLVADVADAVDLARLDELGELARDRVDARLERHLGEHDRLAAALARLDLVAGRARGRCRGRCGTRP